MLTWSKTLAVWWSWLWRQLLVSIGTGLAIGFLLGILNAPDGLGGMIGLGLGIVVSIWALRAALAKHFNLGVVSDTHNTVEIVPSE